MCHSSVVSCVSVWPTRDIDIATLSVHPSSMNHTNTHSHTDLTLSHLDFTLTHTGLTLIHLVFTLTHTVTQTSHYHTWTSH